jgi:hypothetical protein
MAAVEVRSFSEGHRKSDYGVHTTQPWTIGWDKEDTDIRLRVIARAWVGLRKTLRHGKETIGGYASCPSELVRLGVL